MCRKKNDQLLKVLTETDHGNASIAILTKLRQLHVKTIFRRLNVLVQL